VHKLKTIASLFISYLLEWELKASSRNCSLKLSDILVK
jgi:hypothetical protein